MLSQTTRVRTSTTSGLNSRNVSATLAIRHHGRVGTVRQTRTLLLSGRTTSTAVVPAPTAVPAPRLPQFNVAGFCRVCAVQACTDPVCAAVWPSLYRGVCPQCGGSGFADLYADTACGHCIEGVEVVRLPQVTSDELSAHYPCKQLRHARGWSQAELFRRVCRVAAADGDRLPSWETFKRNLHRWEHDRVAVSLHYRQLLARTFDRFPVEIEAVAA